MPKRKLGQNNLLDTTELLSTAACVPAIRAAVKEWREKFIPERQKPPANCSIFGSIKTI
jgi:hypothetical protein